MMKVSDATMIRILGIMDQTVYTFFGFMLGWCIGRSF